MKVLSMAYFKNKQQGVTDTSEVMSNILWSGKSIREWDMKQIPWGHKAEAPITRPWKINVVLAVTLCTVVENYILEEPAASSISTHHIAFYGGLEYAIPVKLYQTTRRQVAEGSNLHGHHVGIWNLIYWYFVNKEGKWNTIYRERKITEERRGGKNVKKQNKTEKDELIIEE